MPEKQKVESKKVQPKPKPAVAPDRSIEQPKIADSALNADSTLQTQAARLGDARLSSVQRQTLATHIGRTQGNQHIQRVVRAMRSTPENEAEEQISPKERETTPTIAQRSSSPMVSRWSEHEHKHFGETAATKAQNHPELLKVSVPVSGKDVTLSTDIPYQDKEGQDTKMSFGEGTELGGDYSRSPQELSEIQTVDTGEMETKMKVVAATNINHFFPLARQEWSAQHATAMDLASQAFHAYQSGDEKLGKSLTQQAIRTEAFALHFMQDSFASGHQYPRALEAVHTDEDRQKLQDTAELIKITTALGLSIFSPGLGLLTAMVPSLPLAQKLLGTLGLSTDDVLTALNGLTKSKVYHDALCALPNGIDMLYGQKFHGDDQRTSLDDPVTQETYNSLAQVLAAISGKNVPGDAAAPKTNPGPDTAKIMEDPEAAPIWYTMEQSIQGLIAQADSEVDKDANVDVTTSSGLDYPVADILQAWKKINEGGREQLDAEPDQVTRLVMAALQGQENILHNATKRDDEQGGTSLDEPGNLSTDTKADDNIIELLKNEDGVLDVNKAPANLTKNQVVMICQALISGACIGNDEHAVLLILLRQTPAVFRAAVAELGHDYIDKGLDFKEWDAFLLAAANRYPAGSNLGAQLIASEKNDNAARLLMKGKQLKGGLFEPPVAKDRLSLAEWTGVIRALISGVCGNKDERTILNVLAQQSDADFRTMVDMLTPQYIDSGIDGAEWDTFLLMCTNRYQAGSNVGAALIASEKNDDAARMLVTGAPNGEPPVQKSRLSGIEWIGVINTLLSGRCGDADEDAIVEIVAYMAGIGQANLVNNLIGSSKMDDGIDGKQWKQIREIMKGAGYNWSWWG